MEMLLYDDIENKLIDLLCNCSNDVNFVTAFCKLNMLKEVDRHIKKGVKKRLLVRFLPSDLMSHSTDKEIFEYCRLNSWELFIDYTIHAKIYVVDKYKCILGSANLTNKGMSVADNSNKEAATYFELANIDYLKILSLYQDSFLLNQDMFDFIISETEDSVVINKIRKKYKLDEKLIKCLMPEDFPMSDIDIIQLKQYKSYKWLKQYLCSKEDKSAYFGELSSVIHSIFINDPRPFRKNIKNYLSNLLEYIKICNDSSIYITKPNYSEKITLVE